MTEKLCLCSAMEAGAFDKEYRGSDHRPEVINWMKRSDGSYETGLLEDEEFRAKVQCQCGKYMKTHLVGKYHKRMVSVCSCDNPKPAIMEIMEMTELHDAVMTYIQTTGVDITEETKKIAEMTDDDVAGCKRFYEMYGRD